MSGAQIKPGYKRTEVGVIPEDWSAKTIGDGIDLLTGFPFPSSEYSDSGVKLLRGSNVKRGQTDWSEEITQYWPLVTQEIARYELREGDLVIAMDGSLVGRSYAKLAKDDLPALLLQRVARIRSTQKLDASYLATFIGSNWFIKHADSVKTVTAIPHISPADISSFSIPIPPTLEEQRAIATALSDVDALLTKLDQLIAKKRDLKQATMQQLLTGQTRLPGFSGEWEMKRLGRFLEFQNNGTFARADLVNQGTVKYLHYGDIHGSSGVFLDTSTNQIPFLPTEKARPLDRIQDGDLIFSDASEDYDGIGKSVEVKNLGEGSLVAGLHTIAVRFQKLVLADGFKAYLQFLPAFRNHLLRLASGTKVYATQRTHIASAELRLPPINEQTAIATVLSDVDAELAALEARRDKTRALKQGMMQELLTGRIRLI